MVFGLNFNGQAIPPDFAKLFKARLRADPGEPRHWGWVLQGVATTPGERDRMLVQANNGHRRLRVVEKEDRYGTVYGVYVS